MRYSKLGFMTVTGLILAACGGSNPEEQRGQSLDAPVRVAILTALQIDAVTSSSGLQGLTGKARCDVTISQINYRTPGVLNGEMSNASGAVLVPSGPNCPGPFPLIAYAKGTDVLMPRTLANPQEAETVALTAFFAAQGYTVVASDFLGYAKSAYPFHPYVHADTEASTVIDSIRNVRRESSALGVALSGKVMLTGYSQGGHSSMATQRAIERDLASEINVVAASHASGAYNLSGALLAGVDNPITDVQFFLPYLITAWQKIYGNIYSNVNDVFNPPYASYIEGLLPNPTLTYTTLITSGALPGDAPKIALNKLLKPSYLNDVATNPNNGTIVAARKQDLLGWNPKARTNLCGGSGDPTILFNIHAEVAFKDFTSRGLTNVTKTDVDPFIKQVYGDVLAADPATFYGSYHGFYVLPFCHKAAKALFDQVK